MGYIFVPSQFVPAILVLDEFIDVYCIPFR